MRPRSWAPPSDTSSPIRRRCGGRSPIAGASNINNERLEFLGDSVLGLAVADLLFVRYPAASVGDLTRTRAALVRKETLAAAAREAGVGEYLVLGTGEQRNGGRNRDSILADAIEALLGAMYVDGGYAAVRRAVECILADRIEQATPDGTAKDPKTRLQGAASGSGSRASPLSNRGIGRCGASAEVPRRVRRRHRRSPASRVGRAHLAAKPNSAPLPGLLRRSPMTDDFRCGTATIVGRPNVGKSTLLNRLVGQKVSITASKPQTTRHRIGGVLSRCDAQIVFVDTPGIHRDRHSAMSRYLNRTARGAIDGVDVVVFMVEALRWTDEDEDIRRVLRESEKPVLLVPNKIDRVAGKAALLPYLDRFRGGSEFEEIIPVSARRREHLDVLVHRVRERLPVAPAMLPPDALTDRSERFLAGELVREKLTRKLDQELPYRLAVEIERFRNEKRILRIGAVVWVERASQKGIVIGKGGRVLKAVGTEARANMETLFGRRVHLDIWVKARAGWPNDEKILKSLGYEG